MIDSLIPSLTNLNFSVADRGRTLPIRLIKKTCVLYFAKYSYLPKLIKSKYSRLLLRRPHNKWRCRATYGKKQVRIGHRQSKEVVIGSTRNKCQDSSTGILKATSLVERKKDEEADRGRKRVWQLSELEDFLQRRRHWNTTNIYGGRWSRPLLHNHTQLWDWWLRWWWRLNE